MKLSTFSKSACSFYLARTSGTNSRALTLLSGLFILAVAVGEICNLAGSWPLSAAAPVCSQNPSECSTGPILLVTIVGPLALHFIYATVLAYLAGAESWKNLRMHRVGDRGTFGWTTMALVITVYVALMIFAATFLVGALSIREQDARLLAEINWSLTSAFSASIFVVAQTVAFRLGKKTASYKPG